MLDVERGDALTPQDPQAWLVGWLRRDGASVLESLVAELTAELPEIVVAAQDPEGHIREAVGAHLDALTAGLTPPQSGRAIEMPSSIDRYTRALARHDTVSLPLLLRSFANVHAALWQQLVRTLRAEGHRLSATSRAEIMERASAHLFRYFETASTRTAALYVTERTLLERRAASHRSEVVSDVLSGSVDAATAHQVLGYDVNAVHIGYVGWVDSVSDLDRLGAAVHTVVDHMRPRQHLTVPSGDRAVLGWLSCSGEHWRRVARERQLPDGVHIAWGAPREGFAGFRATHADALEARRVGRALGEAGSVLYDDVAVASLASRDLAAASAFVGRQLGRLVPGTPTSDRLLDTLRVYLDELASPTRTARRLHVHPNTVVKRVERIEALLGAPVDPASLALRVAVELAPLVRGHAA